MRPLKSARVFPGQGALDDQILHRLRKSRFFDSRFGAVCDALGGDPSSRISTDAEYLQSNRVSSLLTVLASVVSLDALAASGAPPADAVGGYSVGQWTALYAAGMMPYGELITLVSLRTTYMDECVAKQPGAMMAVFGVQEAVLEEFCAGLRANGDFIAISNYNSPGQYSLAGTLAAIERALETIVRLRPMRVQRLSMSGAWHCTLLDDAAERLGCALREHDLSEPSVPVLDNVTGGFLPASGDDVKTALARQVSHPVQWERGVRTLLKQGCERITEVGYGQLLTKFGKFIDRSVDHANFCAV